MAGKSSSHSQVPSPGPPRSATPTPPHDAVTRSNTSPGSWPTDPANPGRDEAEIDLTKQAIKTGLPLLGICRGLQVVRDARGGTPLLSSSTCPRNPRTRPECQPRRRPSSDPRSPRATGWTPASRATFP
ncbi:MAG: gamma-glutamyl-gamma-aminobutyrate hydrolase family protein [Actinobacteria bacterium]|nr:gamma-glutamyl-gamma-aminobutyrate hydrolase family protein [Actinomycetota bacterium]